MDPIEQLMSATVKADHNFEFYEDKLRGIAAACQPYLTNSRLDVNAFKVQLVGSLVDGPNTREDLCYMLIVAIDQLAKS